MPESSARRPVLGTSLAVLTGAVIAGLFLRRQVAALVVRTIPYERKAAAVSSPALIVNRWSGGGKAEKFGIVAAAEAVGIRVIPLERGDNIVDLARTAIADGADAIGAAGGDGSLGLVAGVALEHDVPFFCIPVGTRNHFALDLGLNRDDPPSALAAISDGEEIRIDYGLAGDRPFLNNVSLGVYAEAVHREEYRDNKTETLAAVVSEMGTDEESGTALRFDTPWGGRAERVALTLVSNNPYVWSGLPDHGRRRRLDRGKLGIAAAGYGTTATGKAGSRVRRWEAETLHIEADGPIKAGVDGEAIQFESPLELRIRPKGLRVLVPVGTKPGYVPLRESVAAGIVGMASIAGVPEDAVGEMEPTPSE